jgi:hypothetical protein
MTVLPGAPVYDVQVLGLMVEGRSNLVIAAALMVSSASVEK